MTRTTIKQLEDAFKAEAHITGRLTARINELVERLDKASDFCKQLNTHIVALEEQNDKTRKQLWYLQKVAKGEFEPQTPKKPDQPVQEVHEDVPNQAF